MLALLAALMFQPTLADTSYLLEIDSTLFTEMINEFREARPKEAGVCLYGTQAYVLREEEVVDLTTVTRIAPLRTEDATPRSLNLPEPNGCDQAPDFLGISHSHPLVRHPDPYACSLSGPDILLAIRRGYAIGIVVCSTGWGNVFWNKHPYPISWFPWSSS